MFKAIGSKHTGPCNLFPNTDPGTHIDGGPQVLAETARNSSGPLKLDPFSTTPNGLIGRAWAAQSVSILNIRFNQQERLAM